MKLQTSNLFKFCILIYSLFIVSNSFANIIINEIYYHPAQSLEQYEFIELYNAADQEIDLSNWRFDEGIEYRFPQGSLIPANGYLVITPAPDYYESFYPTINIFGPYQKQLSNSGEMVRLIDANGKLIDEVHYIDELGWPKEADGQGFSIERIHEDIPSSNPASWKASPNGGTPGVTNINTISQPIPIVSLISQSPASPRSDESVTITCKVVHNQPLQDIRLMYKTEESSEYRIALLFDDGEHADRLANDGYYAGDIPPHPNGTLIEFFIQAQDINNSFGFYPNSPLTSTAIYRVDDLDYPTQLPLYQIIMRNQDEQLLRTRNPTSNVELPATFIYNDNIYHTVGVRFRGKGSRWHEPKNYRINFSDTRYFGSIRKLNLNAVEPYRQYIGLEIMKQLDLPAPEKRMVSISFNQQFVNSYIQVERTDKDMMQRLFDEDSGNLYRGVEQANLDYRGEDPNHYRPHYEKITNEFEDDYSDIIALTKAFTNPPTSDDIFIDELSQNINITQWMRWLAAKKIMNDLEGGLSKERGDDYYMYHNPKDGLFYLLPWDMDSVFRRPFLPVHHHTGTLIEHSIGRFVRHPDLAALYYQQLQSILEEDLPQFVVDDIIDQTEPVANQFILDDLKQTSRDLREFILNSIPRHLTVDHQLVSDEILQPENIPVQRLTLSGRANATQTRWVKVNGEFANYIPWQATWAFDHQLNGGIETFLIEALNKNLETIETNTYTFYPSAEHYVVKHQEVWNNTSMPLIENKHVIVPENTFLVIEAGTHLNLSSNKGIIVYGSLAINGTKEAPVTLDSIDSASQWGGISIINSDASLINNTVFQNTHPFTFQERDYNSAVTIQSSTAAIVNSTFSEIITKAIHGFDANLQIQNNRFSNMGEMINLIRSSSFIDHNRFENTIGYSDCIDFDGQQEPTSIISNNIFIGSDDDGIDMGSGASPIIENNWIEGCADKGISLESPSTNIIRNNVIYRCNNAITAGNQAHVEFINNTVVNCESGIIVKEKIEGLGGGNAHIENSIIWNTGISLSVDEKSFADVTHSNLAQLPDFYRENNFSVNPLFIDAENADFHLQQDSPMIDNGITNNLNKDFTGNSRPQGTAYDIGAYEFVPNKTTIDWWMY